MKIRDTELCDDQSNHQITISENVYTELCKQFGYTWYFINKTTIKYFSKDQWHIAKVF